MNVEEEFFKALEINEKNFYECVNKDLCFSSICEGACPYYVKYKTAYPVITSDILLELLLIVIRCCEEYKLPMVIQTKDDLKKYILSSIIKYNKKQKLSKSAKDKIRDLLT